jgi:DNA polymerase-4
MPGRVILHVDMDAYFASVETLAHPEWRGRPVIVGGSTLRSVVSACSYEAKALGVHSAMPLARALALAPDAVFVEGNPRSYTSYTRRILKVLVAHTPLVEPVSIDEAFMDVTGAPGRKGDGRRLAHRVQREILERTGLWASVGVGQCKLLAKMASKRAKPRGVARLDPSDMPPLPADSIWGVGEKTSSMLARYGITTIGDLRRLSRGQMRSLMGSCGELLYYMCRGIDPSPVIPAGETPKPKSISNEHTFLRDVLLPEQYLPALALMAQKVSRRARDRGLAGSTVIFKYRLSNLSLHSRRVRLSAPTDRRRPIYEAARALAGRAVRSPIRLVGVGLSSLAPAGQRQMGLFGGDDRDVARAVDRVRHRYGERAITSARTMRRETAG